MSVLDPSTVYRDFAHCSGTPDLLRPSQKCGSTEVVVEVRFEEGNVVNWYCRRCAKLAYDMLDQMTADDMKMTRLDFENLKLELVRAYVSI